MNAGGVPPKKAKAIRIPPRRGQIKVKILKLVYGKIKAMVRPLAKSQDTVGSCHDDRKKDEGGRRGKKAVLAKEVGGVPPKKAKAIRIPPRRGQIKVKILKLVYGKIKAKVRPLAKSQDTVGSGHDDGKKDEGGRRGKKAV